MPRQTNTGFLNVPYMAFGGAQGIDTTKSIGLHQNAYNPCLFAGNISDPDNPSDVTSSAPLTLGIYIDDFIYFSADPAVEAKFQQLLKKYITVNFMGTVEWFLGTHFQ